MKKVVRYTLVLSLVGVIADKAINTHTRRYIATFSKQPFYTFRKEFMTRLRQHGIKASLLLTNVNTDRLQHFHGKSGWYAKRNFIPLRVKIGANRLLLISVNRWGLSRRYYSLLL